MIKTIKRLSALHGAFGREDSVAQYIVKELEGLGYRTETDALGSITVTLSESGTHALFTGIDTQAYYVTSIDSDGAVRVGAVSAPEFSVPMRVMNERGVGGILTGKDTVDIGAASRAGAMRRARVGDTFAPSMPVTALGGKLTGANLSRRAMAALLLDILSEKPDSITASHIVFTAQESASRGTLCAQSRISPKIAISLMTTDSAKCGDGALSIIKDKGIVSNIELSRALSELADKCDIKSTPVVSDKLGGIPNVMTYAGDGARVCAIGAACERCGTEHECMSVSDLKETRRLIYEALTNNF